VLDNMAEMPSTNRQELASTATAAVDGFAPLQVKHVVRETPDAVSLVLGVPSCDADRFRYRAGQFLTVRVQLNGEEYRRCYSMSSSPAEADLRITVKRDRDGVVSNWLNDTAVAGTRLDAAPPEGRFVLADTDRELVAYAGGSGITPVFSLIHSALVATPRRARLFYANRDRASVIFDEALTKLVAGHDDRLVLRHHLDEQRGVVSAADIAAFSAEAGDADYYICGPGPFMDTVEAAVLAAGVPRERVHLERFSVAPMPVPDADVVTEEVTIKVGRQTVTVPYRAGNTLLQTARMAGLRAPSSCETGSCGTCMAQVTKGSARMINNDALDDDEVADGWVVTCQSLPTSRTVSVVYE
jgi:3-ketosteroid 9alpha-monooxygenase subunit B